MKNEQFVLNTLVYANQIKANEMTQLDVLKKAKEFGFSKVEVRRELFTDFSKEAEEIKKEAEKLNLEIFYSIPEGLFVNNEFNPDFETYLKEIKLLGATHGKWNLGIFADYKGNLFAELDKFDTEGIELNVENDQSETGGLLPSVKTFGERFLGTDKIGLVYDIGNWAIKGYDPVDAAETLKEWVRYIHLKDVSEGKVVPLATGSLDVSKVLEVLPTGTPIAFEFRVEEDKELLNGRNSLLK